MYYSKSTGGFYSRDIHGVNYYCRVSFANGSTDRNWLLNKYKHIFEEI